jgi:hypothetical protein
MGQRRVVSAIAWTLTSSLMASISASRLDSSQGHRPSRFRTDEAGVPDRNSAGPKHHGYTDYDAQRAMRDGNVPSPSLHHQIIMREGRLDE